MTGYISRTLELDCSLFETAPLGCSSAPIGNRILLTGGGVSGVLRCMTFDPSECKVTSEYVDAKGTRNRIGHASCTVANSVYLFGGIRHPRDPNALSAVTTIASTDFGYRIGTTEAESPVGLIGTSAVAVGKERDRVAIFGGLDTDGNFNNDLWIYSPFASPEVASVDKGEEEGEGAVPMGSGRWCKVNLGEHAPVGRAFHSSMAVGAEWNKLIILGGRTAATDSSGVNGSEEGEEGEGRERSDDARAADSSSSSSNLLNDVWTFDLTALLEDLHAIDNYDPDAEDASPPPDMAIEDHAGAQYRTTAVVGTEAVPADDSVEKLTAQSRALVMLAPGTAPSHDENTPAQGEEEGGEDEEPVPASPVVLVVFGGSTATGKLTTSRVHLSPDLGTMTDVNNVEESECEVPVVTFAIGESELKKPFVSGIFPGPKGSNKGPSIRVMPNGPDSGNEDVPAVQELNVLLERARKRAERVMEWKGIMEKLGRGSGGLSGTPSPDSQVAWSVSEEASADKAGGAQVEDTEGAQLYEEANTAEEGGIQGEVEVEGGGGGGEADAAGSTPAQERQEEEGAAGHEAKTPATASLAAKSPPFTQFEPSAYDISLTLANGDSYEGHVQCIGAPPAVCPLGEDDLLGHLSLQPHGIGKLITTENWVHEGVFVNGKPNGHGIHYRVGERDVSKTSGYFTGNKVVSAIMTTPALEAHGDLDQLSPTTGGDGSTAGPKFGVSGQGSVKFLSDDPERLALEGDEYTGMLVAGQRQGSGKLTRLDGSTLEGTWERDKLTGAGVMVTATGDKYEGRFVNSAPDGKVKVSYGSGDVFAGQYASGRRNGFGLMQYADGSTYKGKWVADEMCGSGLLYNSATGESYNGMFKAGKYHGFGEKKYPDGTVYSGDFVEGLEHGNGFIKNLDGSILAVDMNWGCITASEVEKLAPKHNG